MDVLVVEDSPEVSLITVEYLTELGHRAVAVADAERAVEQLGQRTFHAILTDVSLPGMSGIDLAKEVRRRYPGVGVIISSGYGELSVASLLGEDEAGVTVLAKPYDLDALERTLAQVAASGPGGTSL